MAIPDLCCANCFFLRLSDIDATVINMQPEMYLVVEATDSIEFGSQSCLLKGRKRTSFQLIISYKIDHIPAGRHTSSTSSGVRAQQQHRKHGIHDSRKKTQAATKASIKYTGLQCSISAGRKTCRFKSDHDVKVEVWQAKAPGT